MNFGLITNNFSNVNYGSYGLLNDNDDDLLKTNLSSYYNDIVHPFLNYIIAECNVLSYKKMIRLETINKIKKFIYNYNRHTYRTIEEYHEDFNNIEQRVETQITDIEETLYENDLFDKNILSTIYSYSIQYYDMYEYFVNEILKNMSKRIVDVLRNNNTHFFNFNQDDNDDDNLSNLEIDNNDGYENTHIKLVLTNEIEIIRDFLIYENNLILTDDFLIYIHKNMYEKLTNEKQIYFFNNNQIMYIYFYNFINILNNRSIKISYNLYDDIIRYLELFNIKDNDIIYSMLLLSVEDLFTILNEDVYKYDFNYIIQHGNITDVNIIEYIIENYELNYNFWTIFSENINYNILTDEFVTKYQKYLDIDKVIRNKVCSETFIESVKDNIRVDTWNYILKNYNLSNHFLLQNRDELLIYMYRYIQNQN